MIRMFGRTKVFVTVISARRAANVGPMTELVGPATWFVDKATATQYVREVASVEGAVVVADGLCEARNAALKAAFDVHEHPCLQLSDDLKKIEEPIWSEERKKYVAGPLSFNDAVLRMLSACQSTGAKLAGVAPTSNPFYFRGKPVHPRAFIVGDMMLVRPNTVRFDETMRLKEDYDHSLAHLAKYGRVARCDDVLATFQHRSNAGGAVAYRTELEEQRAIDQLKERWGKLIQDNPRRPLEVLLKLR